MLPPFSALVAVEMACRRAGATPKQPIIGSSGRTRSSRPATGGRAGRSGVAVDRPRYAVTRRQLADELGIDDIVGQRRRGPAGVAVRRHGEDLDAEGVARLGTLDEDRPVHRVGAVGVATLVLVPAVGIDRVGDDGVAARDGQHRRAGCARTLCHVVATKRCVAIGIRPPATSRRGGRPRRRPPPARTSAGCHRRCGGRTAGAKGLDHVPAGVEDAVLHDVPGPLGPGQQRASTSRMVRSPLAVSSMT